MRRSRTRSGPARLLFVVALGVATGCSGTGTTETTTTTSAAVETTTTIEAPLSAGEQISFYVPAVGDCYDVRPVDGAASIYLQLDCLLPHGQEVFAVVEYTATREYPGPAALEAQAKLECPRSWSAYVGAPYETSRFEIAYALPEEATWGNGVRHVIGCLIVDPRGDRISGSARGVAQ